MWFYQKIAFVFILLLFSSLGYAQQIHVNSVSYETDASQSKIVFDLTDAAKQHVFVLDKPARLVIDLGNTKVNRGLKQPSSVHPLFSKLRASEKNDTDLRVVVELKEKVSAKTHKLGTYFADSRHLVVKLVGKQVSGEAVKGKNSAAILASSKVHEADSPSSRNTKPTNGKSKHLKGKKHMVIAIDAGHGGDDPGARGPNGTYEKQVTLAIAQKLQGLINGQPGMKARMVRKGDYYVGLRDRVKIARKLGADLFISIHADACDNSDVKGASVYTLSRTGASNEAARWLANNENAKEKVAGVNLGDKDEVLASVLLDLSQTATQQASMTLADKVLKHFRHIGDLHYDTVQKAGFAVLKSPDIPSILVETAYISNPSDELNLLSNRYQSKMANAIFKGVLNYFEQAEPVETRRLAKL